MFKYQLTFQDIQNKEVFKFTDPLAFNYCNTCDFDTVYIKYTHDPCLCMCYYCKRVYTTDLEISVEIVKTTEI